MPPIIRPIEYTVFLHAPQTQSLQILMVVRDITTSTVDVALPVWRTGRYSILNPAGTVHGVRARRNSGEALPILKLDKTTWRVQTQECTEMEVSYTVHANSLNDRTRHVDDTHAFLSGATVFLYVPDRRNDAIAVHLKAPEHWSVACGLESAHGDPRTLLAPSYDLLVDSPLEIGVHDVLRFEVRGIPHEIVLWGAPSLNAEKLKDDFAAIVENEADLLGGLPYKRYIFIIHVFTGHGGGTEHFNSTIMQVSPRAFEDDAEYKRLLFLASHELFHAWNVKRLRPAALARTDFTRENYTDLLWFCEGTTSYYDELVLARAGLTSPDEYLSTLGELIQKVRRRPGSRVQSVAESSFDAWIKFNQPTSDEMNTTVSFYDSGALVSLLLDMELRTRTENRASLDTLMREMVKRFPVSGPGFTTEDLIEVASEISGSRFEEFFDRYIRATDPLPLEERVEIVGLELALDGVGIKAYTGLMLYDKNSMTFVRYVLTDGPAHMAGVLASDEIVALNGRRYSAVDFVSHVEQQMKPGDRVELEVIRRGRQRTIEFLLGSRPKGRWCLSRVASPTASQRAAYSSWIHQPWPET